MIVLSIYLVLVGLEGLFHLPLGEFRILLPITAIIAGVLIFIGK